MSYRFWTFLIRALDTKFTYGIEDGEALAGSLGVGEDIVQKDYRLKLLTGEIEAARASNVSLYIAQKIKSQSKKKKAQQLHNRVGLLIITNFRLSFVTFDDKDENTKCVSYQENYFLGKYDVTLSNIDEIYQITDKKKKLVAPQYKNAAKIEALRIICKNFRMLTFDFQTSEIGKGKYIADALIKFAFPTRHNLLFLYQYREKYYNTSRTIRMYRDKTDWIQELERCGVSSQDGGWRVLSTDRLERENGLPMNYVVPRHLGDAEYLKMSNYFRCKRTAIWVWSLEKAALVRMADLLPDLTTSTYENTMLEHVRRCDPAMRQPILIDLSKNLPTIQDINQSYLKLRELCAPDSDRQLMIQDERFYALLEKSCWLFYVSLSIKQACEAANHMKAGETVVLQENDGRDICCIISSLVQIILDPYFRTITGIQTLIQKEWIAMGHPFSDRIGNVHQATEKSPLFLLFVDCVWQLLNQYPESFEYSETFLTTIWDSVFLPIFDTFQFNCEFDRQIAINSDRLISRPVWDWGETFTDKDIALFSNPLYKKPQMSEQDLEVYRRSRLPPSAFRLPGMEDMKVQRQQVRSTLDMGRLKLQQPSCSKDADGVQLRNSSPENGKLKNDSSQDKFLDPSWTMRDLDVFKQCYYRWMPILEIKNGGFAQIDLFNRRVVNNIHKLQKALETGNLNDLPPELLPKNPKKSDELSQDDDDDDDDPIIEEVINRVPVVNSFFPFTSNIDNTEQLTDFLIENGECLTEGSIFEFE